MKKNYFFTLLLTLCLSGLSFGQGSETFTGATLPTSYADDSFTGSSGITWTYVASRDANGDNNSSGISLPALMLRRASSGSKVTSSTISGGVGDFSVKLYKGFTGGGNREVELFINGVSKGTSTPFDDFDEHVFTVSGLNISGDVIIELVNTTAKQIIVDDITWTAPSANPVLSINSPSDGAVLDATTSVDVTVSTSNFVVGELNGSGVDGHIHWTLQENSDAAVTQPMKYDTNDESITVAPGNSYTIYMEFVDNTHTAITPAVNETITFSVAYSCDLVLGDMATTCDALTSGVDSYSGSIAFTGGDTGVTYVITAPAGVTVAGDSPDTTTAGTITFSGMTEGTDAAITIVGDTGSSCDLSRTLNSPVCKSFPIYESFDYTVGTDLIASADWQDASTSGTPNDIQVVAGTMMNPFSAGEFPDPVGAMVNLVGGGSDPYIAFNATSTGTIYTSFLFSPTDISTMTDTTDGGYFVALAESGGSFRARLYIRQTAADNTMYEIGISDASSATDANFDTTLSYTPGEETFIVLSFEFATNEIRVWANPDPATFEGTPGTQNLLHVSGSTTADLGRFILRQDSTGETPSINFDELRIGTSWADVTPKDATASVGNISIEGFATYPNPVSNNTFTITTSSNSKKEFAIFNVLGKKMLSSSFSGVKSEVDVSTISSGIYILKVTEDGKTATKKLVIR